MDLGAVVFYAVAAATLVAALGVVVTRSVVYSALLLILTLAMTGLVYLLLLSDFLALVQILVYGGTVSILLLFALMLTRPRESPVLNHRGWPLAALGAVLLGVVLLAGALGTDWAGSLRTAGVAGTTTASATSATAGRSGTTGATSAAAGRTTAAATAAAGPQRLGPEQIGAALFTTWAVPFEIASVVLLVALIGSLLIARATDPSDPDTEALTPPGSPAANGRAIGVTATEAR